MCRLHIEDGFALDQTRQSGVRLGDQRDLGVALHDRNERQHGLGSRRAIGADRICAEALQRDQGGDRIGAVQSAAVLFIRHCDNGKQIGYFPDGDQGSPGFLNVDHGLDHKEIHAAFEKAPRLLLKNFNCLLEGQIPEGLEKCSGRPDIAGYKRFSGGSPFGQDGEIPVDSADIILSVLLQFEFIGAEGAGRDDVRSRIDIIGVNRFHDGRVIQTPHFRAEAPVHAALLQLGPGRSV